MEKEKKIRRKNHPDIHPKLWAGSLCSPSYFVGSCEKAPISITDPYIE